MRLTTRGRFAVTAMLDLALYGSEEKPLPLIVISERQDISLSYLEQIFSKLRRSGLVCSTRGPTGGYTLARKCNEINISQIITAVEDNLDATQCGGATNCRRGATCLTHDLWQSLNRTIDGYLSEITLHDVLKKNYPN